MKKLNQYRNECCMYYDRLRKGAVMEEIRDNMYQIRRQVLRFVSAMRSYKKQPALSAASVALAHRLSEAFFRSADLSVEAMYHFLDRAGRKYRLDFYAFDLFFDFLRLHAVKKIYQLNKAKQEEEAAHWLGDIFRMLHAMENVPRDVWLAQVCAAERQLLEDEIYAAMTEKSRAVYRQKIAKMAKKSDKTVDETVDFLIKKAQKEQKHIGFLLEKDKKTAKKWLYFLGLGLSTLVLSIQLYILCGNLFLSVLSLIPSYFAAKVFVGQLMASLLPNEYLVRLKKDSRQVAKARSCVIVPSLLTEENVELLTKKLEMLYLQNRQANAVFGLLLDLPESDKKVLPGERKLNGKIYFSIDTLNRTYGERFFVGIRKRTFSQTQQKYIGADRKRGAIEEWIEMIMTGHKGIPVYGARPKKAEYLLVLDQDTEPEIGALNELVSIACHPLNRPVYDHEKKRITAGYGVLSASTLHNPLSGWKTMFGRMLLSVDPTFHYPVAHHELYQDLFDCGSFCGKGLIDIAAYHQVLCGRLPREQILSHDLLEGALLRTGYASDIAFAESQPDTVLSYYKREHRWIRGDWQLLRGAKGLSLSALDRYKMWENLLRSIWPAVSMILMVGAAILGGWNALFVIVTALMPVIALPYMRILDQCLTGSTLSRRVQYYSRVLPAFEGALVWSLYEIAALPYRAVNALDAAFRALYRQFVSGRHLLDWTVFAQTQNKTVFSYRPILIAVIGNMGLGILFTVLLRWPAALFFAWAGVPALFVLLSHKSEKKKAGLTIGQQEDVLRWARQMWGYIKDRLCDEDHYLLADNQQFSPDVGVAHRTSPTNIGLSLVGVLAARDLGFIDTQTTVDLITRILDSVEKLERCFGHLYNWYDTRTAQPLPPAYVSTVDSGNFVVCLSVLAQGLEQYRTEHVAIDTLIRRIREQERLPDFLKLYDPQRKLLYIGYQVQQQKTDENHYDLLMSEARLTSFYLCAKGILPKEHWQALERVYVTDGGRFGLRSWTGTMFEYFMPLMFLPVWEGTQQYEAIRFTLQQQQKWAGTRPFGVSESCYYAFDAGLSFQYKAMGIPNLGQKNGLDKDYVVSPYACFLAMPYAPEQAYKNLIRLEKEGATGRYGFYEAVDYTPSRVGHQPGIVATFMAHHIGMSLISCANILRENVFISRFLQDPQVAAYLPLAQNGLPRHVNVAESENSREMHLPIRQTVSAISDRYDIDNPRMVALSAGKYTALIGQTGVGYSIWDGVNVTRYRNDLLTAPKGIYVFMQTGDELVSLTPAPFYPKGIFYQFDTDEHRACFTMKHDGIEALLEIWAHGAGEHRKITLKNTKKTSAFVTVFCYFEPSLTPFADEKAHPAFHGLSMECMADDGNGLLFHKRKRGEEDADRYLWAGLTGASSVQYASNRTKIGRAEDPVGPCIYPCFFAQTILQIQPNSTCELFLKIGVGRTAVQAKAVCSVSRTVRQKPQGSSVLALEQSILSGLLYPGRNGTHTDRESGALCETLWSFGVSGDLPYLALEVTENVGTVRPYLECMGRLWEKGVTCEIIFLYPNQGNYERPVHVALTAWIVTMGLEKKIGRRGGIHLCPWHTQQQRQILLAKASCVLPPRTAWHAYRDLPLVHKATSVGQDSGFTEQGYRICPKSGQRPMWFNVLARSGLGTVLSDSSLGFTFFKNANQFRITPWSNDPIEGDHGERLLIKIGSRFYDILTQAMCEFVPNGAVYRSAAEGMVFETSVSVDELGKQITVKVIKEQGLPVNVDVLYGVVPCLGRDPYSGVYEISRHRCGYYLRNGFDKEFWRYTAYLCCENARYYTRDQAAFLNGDWGSSASGHDGVFAACGTRIRLKAGEEKSVRFCLGCATTAAQAYNMVELFMNGGRSMPREDLHPLVIQTPDGDLNDLVNHFLYAQILLGRIEAKSGYYQTSGAYGFRDQLQDCMNMKTVQPLYLKHQIIRSCLHQFSQGDVMHWWHSVPRKGHKDMGVRTRCSDDMLWLPLAVAEYTSVCQDAICDWRLPYLEAPELTDTEKERYASADRTAFSETVYEHCLRAFARALQYGRHGLLRMGTGDWNDGFSSVGDKGRGESVWLSQFAVYVIDAFLPVCQRRKDHTTIERLIEHRKQLISAVEESGWDGAWYRRAYFDDGAVLGSRENEECQIDLMPQAFAAMSGAFNPKRVEQADRAVEERLVDKQAGIIRLFSPSFISPKQDPGYVNGYVEGVRENGGQYTHGACFAVYGRYCRRDADGAYRWLRLLNPVAKYRDGQGEKYAKEPYVLCGDVYAAPTMVGHGGWSWYTGAAGWYFRIVMEKLLGIVRSGNHIVLQPQPPSSWTQFEAALRIEGTDIRILYEKSEKPCITVDGRVQNFVPLDRKRHEVMCCYD